jgi:hypothetical protein
VPIVSCVIGLALPGALPDLDKPFRAADIALYHARHHGLPYAVYRPGMIHPTAADRHSSRLRDRHPSLPAVAFDIAAFDRLVRADGDNGTGVDDDVVAVRELAELLDTDSYSFGTDVGDLLDRCADLGLLRWRAPITEVLVEPTAVGEYRDGGLRVLVTVGGTLTLASPRWRPDRSLTERDGPVAAAAVALDIVIGTACQLYTAYEAVTAASRGDR